MVKIGWVLGAVSVLSLVLSVVSHFGVKALTVIAMPEASLEFAEACAQLGILAVLLGWACKEARPNAG
jgi:hypothetical protein